MMPTCISVSLDRAVSEAVYIELRRPSRPGRPWPHVFTVGPTGLQNYVPGAPLAHMWEALDYDGVTWPWDTTDPQPWRSRELLLAAWVFAGAVTWWALRRAFKGFLRKTEPRQS